MLDSTSFVRANPKGAVLQDTTINTTSGGGGGASSSSSSNNNNQHSASRSQATQSVRLRRGVMTSMTGSSSGNSGPASPKAGHEPLESGRIEKEIPPELQSFMKDISCPGGSSDEEDTKLYSPKSLKKRAKARVNTNMKKAKEKQAPPPTTDDDDSESPLASPSHYASMRGNFTEYEVALLWNQFKENFTSGKVNRLQLAQMLRKVFPKCDQHTMNHVTDNLMSIFDTKDTGTVAFREVLTAFVLSMHMPPVEKLHWTFRVCDEEGNEAIDVDDLSTTVVKICEFCRRQELILIKKEAAAKKKSGEGSKEEMSDGEREKLEKERSKMLKKEAKIKKKRGEKKEEMDRVGLMSNRLSHRVEHHKHRKRQEVHAQKVIEKQITETEAKLAASHVTEEQPKVTVPDDERDLAKATVRRLDTNRDGLVTREEFVEGCLLDHEFLAIVSRLNGQLIWGKLLESQ